MTAGSLSEYIKKEIETCGPLTFARFMEIALYHEKWGYYTQNVHLGREGDFYTSPHVGPDFGRMLTRQFLEMWELAGKPAAWKLVECGPGEGLLCRDILNEIRENQPDFYRHLEYSLVEYSPSLAKRQKDMLAQAGFTPPVVNWYENFNTINPLPFTGCIFGNELIDAFPVHLVRQTEKGLKELYVTTSGDKFDFILGPASTPQLEEYFARQDIELAPGQTAEINLQAINWLAAAASALQKGFILIIDYGAAAEQLYTPDRFDGTLRCFRQYRLTSSPLENVGQQDITASVNFTALKIWGEAMGLQCLGTISQSRFLINLGILNELRTEQEYSFDPGRVKKLMAIKQLVMPEGMGNVFRVQVFGKGFAHPPELQGLKGKKYI